MLGTYGTTSPAILPRRMQALLDVLPNGRAGQVQGGHAAQASDPEGFAGLILAYLAQRDAR